MSGNLHTVNFHTLIHTDTSFCSLGTDHRAVCVSKRHLLWWKRNIAFINLGRMSVALLTLQQYDRKKRFLMHNREVKFNICKVRQIFLHFLQVGDNPCREYSSDYAVVLKHSNPKHKRGITARTSSGKIWEQSLYFRELHFLSSTASL